MNVLDEWFSSRAQTAILRVLSLLPAAVGLRELARLADIHPRSAERVLDNLVNAMLVLRSEDRRPKYRLNDDHQQAASLRRIISAATQEDIRCRSSCWDDSAKALLPFMLDAQRMIDHAKEGIHDA